MSLSAAVDKLLSLGSGSPDVTPANFELSMRSLTRETVVWPNASGAGIITAGTALVETPLGHARQKSRLIAFDVAPTALIPGTATNFATIIVGKRTVALPGTLVTLITYPIDTTTTDDLPAWAATNLITQAGATLSATLSDFVFGAGDVLTMSITKSGTGLSIPICEMKATFEPRD